MLTKRIIPCLDIKDGRTVKGINFKGLRDAGDPIELAKRYVQEGADELVFLDIKASVDGQQSALEMVEKEILKGQSLSDSLSQHTLFDDKMIVFFLLLKSITAALTSCETSNS